MVEPDGSIVAAGRSNLLESIVARYRPDGTLDPSFGNGGIVAMPVATTAEPRALVRQPDGKFLVAGPTCPNDCLTDPGDVALVRYDANGALDLGFGTGGVVRVDGGRVEEEPRAVLLQPDGRIVVVAASGVGSDIRAWLLRFESDGSPDGSFGLGGSVLGLPQFVPGNAVLQPDGRIVVVGFSSPPSIVVQRFLPDGSLDPTFATGGVSTLGDVLIADLRFGLALQSDGKIVLGGRVGDAEHGFAVLRLNTDGMLDPTFGTAGMARTSFTGTGEFVSAVVVQPDGRIVAAGSHADMRDVTSLALARYEPDGSLDATFAPCATVSTPLVSSDGSFESNAGLLDLALAPDGKLVGAGFAPEPDGFLVVRYGEPAITSCQPALSGRSKLTFGKSSIDASLGQRTRFKWRWRSSEAVFADDFGDPTLHTGVAVCVFDQTSSSPVLTLENPPRAGRPYWVRKSRGFTHRPGTAHFDGVRGAFGLVGLSLVSGGAGRGSIAAKQNTFLAVAQPLSGPVRVRLATSDTTACFEAVFSSALVNDAARYKAVSD